MGGGPRLECSSCAFCLCSPCDRKGLFRGYYSLGSIDSAIAKNLVRETCWVRYKAQRYMAAAGAAGGTLGLDAWLQKVGVRLYGDLGIELPSKMDLIEMYRRFN